MTETLGRKYSDFNKSVKNSCKRYKKQWIEIKCQEAGHAYSINLKLCSQTSIYCAIDLYIYLCFFYISLDVKEQTSYLKNI